MITPDCLMSFRDLMPRCDASWGRAEARAIRLKHSL
jgi:hypothetical protein